MVGKQNRKPSTKQRELLKSAVMRLEKSNYSNLILFHTNDEWYKIGGNSLLIYFFCVAPRLNLRRQPNIQPDNDYTDTVFEDGVISFHTIDKTIKRLKEVDLFDSIENRGEYVIIHLKITLADTNIKEFRENLHQEFAKSLSVIPPDTIVYPDIYFGLRYLQKRTYEISRCMNAADRDYVGRDIAARPRQMLHLYISINRGRTAEVEGFRKILILLDSLTTDLDSIAELHITNPAAAITVAEKAIETRRIVEATIKRLSKKK